MHMDKDTLDALANLLSIYNEEGGEASVNIDSSNKLSILFDRRTSYGGTILHCAIFLLYCEMRKGEMRKGEHILQIVKLLIDAWGDVDVTDYWGRTVLHLASRYRHTEIVKLLLEAGADVNARDVFKRTALYYASRHGYEEIVKLLLDAGAINNNKE